MNEDGNIENTNYSVNKKKVKKALDWLIINNPVYRDKIRIS